MVLAEPPAGKGRRWAELASILVIVSLASSQAACPPSFAAIPAAGCDAIQLTADSAIEQESDGIARLEGTMDGVRIEDGQSIDIKDEGCYQLGKNGSSFSISMWLKADGGSQIIGTASQYNQGPTSQGFILYTRDRPDGLVEFYAASDHSAPHGPGRQGKRSVKSVPFDSAKWTHIAVVYRNNGVLSTFSVGVNLVWVTGPAFANVYNSKLRIGDEGWGSIAPFEVADLLSYSRELRREDFVAHYLAHADAGPLWDSLMSLSSHVHGEQLLTATELKSAAAVIADGAALLVTNRTMIESVLGLIDDFEAIQGPLFVSASTRNGLARHGFRDGRDLERAMLAVQQAVLDTVFTHAAVQGCGADLLDGRAWQTAASFPGPVDPPPSSDELQQEHNVTLKADVPPFWGRPVAYATDPVRKPTGLYLSPGSLGYVTVPAELVDSGYEVLVGAHTSDHSNKNTQKRLDRVSTSFPIRATTTMIANPLGGGVYIVVPYLASDGLVEVSLQGVIPAPYFAATSVKQTSAAEWNLSRTARAPWADYESDKLLMQVPSAWIYAKPYPLALMQTWDAALDGSSDLFGYPPELRNRQVLYVQVDVQIRHGAFGIGYPQVNNVVGDPTVGNGDSNHWLVNDPVGWEVEWHELGHAYLFSKFRGETEAVVNLPHCYIRNVTFGVDLDTAFRQSFGPAYGDVGFTPDDAAIHWMITENFRAGREMDYSNTERDEFRYQQRGYAKYADIARVFGWESLEGFFHQENLDFMSGAAPDGLSAVDSRIFRMSLAAGADVTPLIHFWGIFPTDHAELRRRIREAGLNASAGIRTLLDKYEQIVPADNIEFNDHFERVYPGRPAGGNPNYGRGWYNEWRDVWDETHAAAAKAHVRNVKSKYFEDVDVGCDACGADEVCWQDLCYPSCDAGGITCAGAHEICELGRCVDICLAETLAVDCAPGHTCVVGRGCVEMCGGGVCADGETCWGDECHPSCDGVSCTGANQICELGACVDACEAQTVALDCRWREQCVVGKGCVARPSCGTKLCQVDQICWKGRRCITDWCTVNDVQCPGNKVCVNRKKKAKCKRPRRSMTDEEWEFDFDLDAEDDEDDLYDELRDDSAQQISGAWILAGCGGVLLLVVGMVVRAASINRVGRDAECKSAALSSVEAATADEADPEAQG